MEVENFNNKLLSFWSILWKKKTELVIYYNALHHIATLLNKSLTYIYVEKDNRIAVH